MVAEGFRKGQSDAEEVESGRWKCRRSPKEPISSWGEERCEGGGDLTSNQEQEVERRIGKGGGRGAE